MEPVTTLPIWAQWITPIASILTLAVAFLALSNWKKQLKAKTIHDRAYSLLALLPDVHSACKTQRLIITTEKDNRESLARHLRQKEGNFSDSLDGKLETLIRESLQRNEEMTINFRKQVAHLHREWRLLEYACNNKIDRVDYLALSACILVLVYAEMHIKFKLLSTAETEFDCEHNTTTADLPSWPGTHLENLDSKLDSAINRIEEQLEAILKSNLQ